jgi:hypothetical protein
MKIKVYSNPKGIASLSPRLTAQRTTLGCAFKWISTLKGLRRSVRRGYNSFRVEANSQSSPRVARASQPWAEGCNPFRIASKANARQMIKP